VPCPAIGLARGVGCNRQRAVRLAPVDLLSGPVDRRARERVAEIHAGCQRDEPGPLGGLQAFGIESEDGERAREGPQLADIACGDDEKGAARRARELGETAAEAMLHGCPCVDGLVERSLFGELRRGQARRELDQRQWIPERDLD
jgi:hypothetical protein